MVKNTLRLKLFRDMRKSAMQFVAIVLLTALGTWCFSGLDAAWRMLELSCNTFFEEQRLADMWITLPNLTQQDVRRIAALPGVETVQPRQTLDMDTDLPSDAQVNVHGMEGAITLNIPLIQSGQALKPSDLRGCLVEESFANANGLALGDRITLEMGGMEWPFILRGTCTSPEHMVTTQGVANDPLHYGFMVVNSQALSEIPWNECALGLAPDADRNALRESIEAMYPHAFVLDQDAHASTKAISSDIVMFSNLSILFPLLAFTVASMIVLTTLKRLIENQRLQMGTLKSLGYRDSAIARHYLQYAIYPSLAGALLGLYAGRYSIPYILWDLEATRFTVPARMQAPISLASWGVCLAAVLLSCGMCLIAYRNSAREVTAALLRPKPPKAGSRLFLERITGLWSRMGFNSKLVARSIFRNKGRTLMSLTGILACNALIITSLGLTDSMRYTVAQYYEGTVQYDLRVDLTSEAGELEAYQRRLDAALVEGIMETAATLQGGGSLRTSTLTILEEEQRLLHLGKDQSHAPIAPEGIAVTQKLQQEMGVAEGDLITLSFPADDKSVVLPITQTLYSNVGQGVYMSRGQWEKLHKGAFIPTALLISQPGPRCVKQAEDLDELDDLKYPPQQQAETLQILNACLGIFSLLAAAALGLAFIICYNMGLINFMERSRDYATLKVLGYHQKEIKHLIISENQLVALLGTVLGVYPGILLTGAVMKSCQPEGMVNSGFVSLKSILIASAVTFVFSYLIQRFLTRKVKTLDMVASLKSVE